MAYKVNELTGEQIEELQKKYPKGKFEKYQLVEETTNGKALELSYHATEEEALKELGRWIGRDEIVLRSQEALEDVLAIAKQFNVEPDEARQMFKET